jgi:hypothetical protein
MCSIAIPLSLSCSITFFKSSELNVVKKIVGGHVLL